MEEREFCLAQKCTFRRQVEKNKAFCMFPKCPYKNTAKFSKKLQKFVRIH